MNTLNFYQSNKLSLFKSPIFAFTLQNRSERVRESPARPQDGRVQAADRRRLQDEDGRDGKHSDQTVQRPERLREEHIGRRGKRHQQRHPQNAAGRHRSGAPHEALRHEEVPAGTDKERLSPLDMAFSELFSAISAIILHHSISKVSTYRSRIWH